MELQDTPQVLGRNTVIDWNCHETGGVSICPKETLQLERLQCQSESNRKRLLGNGRNLLSQFATKQSILSPLSRFDIIAAKVQEILRKWLRSSESRTRPRWRIISAKHLYKIFQVSHQISKFIRLARKKTGRYVWFCGRIWLSFKFDWALLLKYTPKNFWPI